MTRHSRWIVLLALLVLPAVLPTEALAQRARVARRPAVRPVVYVSARPYYRPFYYSPFFFAGYGGWYSGYGWYPGHFYGPPYPYQYRYYGYYVSSARLHVRPKHAEVFIDGYFVGTVDQFDGWSQRLDVEPGEHELEIFLAGHRTYREKVLFRPGATIKIEQVLQPLAPGEPEESRPAPSAPAPSRPPERRGDPMPPRRSGPPPPEREAGAAEYGSLAIRVQPRDAQVIVDGEEWESPEAGNIILQLNEGTHRVEVRKDGYRTYSADVRVRRGETSSVNVSLSRQ